MICSDYFVQELLQMCTNVSDKDCDATWEVIITEKQSLANGFTWNIENAIFS